MLNSKDRYLEKIGDEGRVFIWTPRLATRKDMREFFPDIPKEEVILFDEISPKEKAGIVTREFLEARTADELKDYASKVYEHKFHHMTKPETMVERILDMQKERDIEEE